MELWRTLSALMPTKASSPSPIRTRTVVCGGDPRANRGEGVLGNPQSWYVDGGSASSAAWSAGARLRVMCHCAASFPGTRSSWAGAAWVRLKHLLDDDRVNDPETEQRITSLVEALRAAKSADRAWLAWRAQPSETALAEVDQRMRELRGRLDTIRTPGEQVSVPAGGE
jgi:hypothetical protein